jgi:hypothetical protein
MTQAFHNINSIKQKLSVLLSTEVVCFLDDIFKKFIYSPLNIIYVRNIIRIDAFTQ